MTMATDDGERAARTAAVLSEMNRPGWSVRGYTLNGYSKYISQEPLEWRALRFIVYVPRIRATHTKQTDTKQTENGMHSERSLLHQGCTILQIYSFCEEWVFFCFWMWMCIKIDTAIDITLIGCSGFFFRDIYALGEQGIFFWEAQLGEKISLQYCLFLRSKYSYLILRLFHQRVKTGFKCQCGMFPQYTNYFLTTKVFFHSHWMRDKQ